MSYKIIAAGVALGLLGCSQPKVRPGPGPVPPSTRASATTMASTGDNAVTGAASVLTAGQKLHVEIDDLQQPNLTAKRDLTVGPDGKIKLDYLKADVAVAGLTPSDAAAAISKAYREAGILNNAVVRVALVGPVSPGKAQ